MTELVWSIMLKAALTRGLAAIAVAMAIAPLSVFVEALTTSVFQSLTAVTLITGAGGALLVAPLISRTGIMNVLGHELGHFLPAMLTGGHVTEFVATESAGGHILGSGGLKAPVTLGPYVLPLAALALSLASLLQRTPPTPVWVGLIGFATGYHVVRVVTDVRDALWHGVVDTDLEILGTFASLCWIVAFNILILTSLAVFCVAGPSGMWTFWGASWDRVLDFVGCLRTL